MIGFDKGIIQRSFSRAAATYDAYAGLQKEAARDLLELVRLGPEPRSILDVGCGTGGVTAGLVELFPEALVMGCDIARPMTERARDRLSAGNNHKGAVVFTSDCEDLPLCENTVDLITAGLVFQWAVGLEQAFGEACRVLRPGGRLYLTTLGPRTLGELRQSVRESERVSGANGLPPFMDFVEPTAVTHALREAGFGVTLNRIDLRIKEYADMWALLRTLKNIGAANPHPNPGKTLARGGVLKHAAKAYERAFSRNGGIYATYELLFIVAKKL